ncbi:MAG: hypothetical protein WC489_01990 [Patescibacteria group bacterium]
MGTLLAAFILFGAPICYLIYDSLKKKYINKLPYIIIGLLVVVIAVMYFLMKGKNDKLNEYECLQTHSAAECNQMRLDNREREYEAEQDFFNP